MGLVRGIPEAGLDRLGGTRARDQVTMGLNETCHTQGHFRPSPGLCPGDQVSAPDLGSGWPSLPFLEINYNFLNQRAGLKAGGWDCHAEGRQVDQGAYGSSDIRAYLKPPPIKGRQATLDGLRV